MEERKAQNMYSLRSQRQAELDMVISVILVDNVRNKILIQVV